MEPDDHSNNSELIGKLDGYFAYYKGLMDKIHETNQYFKNIHKQTTFDYVYENENKIDLILSTDKFDQFPTEAKEQILQKTKNEENLYTWW